MENFLLDTFSEAVRYFAYKHTLCERWNFGNRNQTVKLSRINVDLSLRLMVMHCLFCSTFPKRSDRLFAVSPTTCPLKIFPTVFRIEERILDVDYYNAQNSRRINSLEKELGNLKYSFFDTSKQVVAHHGLLLPIERQLNETLFKAKDGIHAIVATATLAQGINLPAEVVIIAGDYRFDEDTYNSEELLVHEILNAAGRAGMAAQGIVILVPSKMITFENRSTSPIAWQGLQQRVFSKSDQCLTIVDPLTQFLDEVTSRMMMISCHKI